MSLEARSVHFEAKDSAQHNFENRPPACAREAIDKSRAAVQILLLQPAEITER